MNVQSHTFTPVFDEGRHPRGKLGFVLLATEQTVQDDMMRICPDGVGVHFARVQNADVITNETLAAIAPELTRASATLLPDGSLDVVSYACTSGSLVLGQERVEDLLSTGNPGAKPSSIIAAVLRALQAVQAREIVVVTPYLDEINTAERDYMTARGFEVQNIQGLNLERDSDMVRVAPAYLADMAAGMDREAADAIFISCGALRSIDIIEDLEARTGKPVITSNQALAWDALRLAGINDKIPGFGRLLRDH
ncbi:MAG: arylmalonate decarboxylase [Pseudomonadota bacterium]